ncbi:MAG: SprT-like domain-containing protein [Candidatus Thiodiazotropha sp. DIVDIV]
MNKSQLQSEASLRTRQLLASAEQHFGLAPSHPSILFDLKGKAAGMLILHKNGLSKIRYNPDLLENYGQKFLKQTVPHEVAHLVARSLYGPTIKPHGKEWQAIMSFFKTPAIRCHSFDTKLSTVRSMRYFEYRCNCQNHRISAIRHNRVRSGITYLCRECGSSLIYIKAS